MTKPNASACCAEFHPNARPATPGTPVSTIRRTPTALLERAPIVDWRQVTDALVAAGLSLDAIAASLLVPKPTLQSWRAGHQPNHADGQAVLALRERMLAATAQLQEPFRRPPPTRWGDVISEMQSAGFSLRDIGGAIGVARSTVRTWQQGAAPGFEAGRALLTLNETVRPYVDAARAYVERARRAA